MNPDPKTVTDLTDPDAALADLASVGQPDDPGVGGAFPASQPVERTEEDAVEADASEGEAATEPAEGAPAGEVPAAEPAATEEGGA